MMKQREDLEQTDLLQRSEALVDLLHVWLQKQNPGAIALYRSYRNEPLLLKLESLWPREKLFFPVVQPARGVMEFYSLPPEGQTQENRYGIVEPVPHAELRLEADTSCVMLIPALAFDRRGYRLGYGAGYYDRYLNHYPGITVGICFESFLIEQLPREPHDKPVQHIATERRFYADLVP